MIKLTGEYAPAYEPRVITRVYDYPAVYRYGIYMILINSNAETWSWQGAREDGIVPEQKEIEELAKIASFIMTPIESVHAQ